MHELGAKEVHVNWNDEILTKMKYENAPMEVFENFLNGMLMAWEYAEDGAGFYPYSQDPELLKDIDPKKLQLQQVLIYGIKEF